MGLLCCPACGGDHAGITCPAPMPTVRVRAVIHEERIFVCLADLIAYVEAAAAVPDAPRQLIASLLERLGDALERD